MLRGIQAGEDGRDGSLKLPGGCQGRPEEYGSACSTYDVSKGWTAAVNETDAPG